MRCAGEGASLAASSLRRAKNSALRILTKFIILSEAPSLPQKCFSLGEPKMNGSGSHWKSLFHLRPEL